METMAGQVDRSGTRLSGARDRPPPRFMNVRQVARYLQLNEKKIYSLVSEGSIPATKITGKWIFPRDLVDRWLLESSHGGVLTDRLTLAGGEDPLLGRVIMALTGRVGARAHIGYSSTGTALGLSLLARRHVDACAIHWGPAQESLQRHTGLIRRHPQHHDWVLVRVCMREQGLMVRPEHQHHSLHSLLDAPLRWITRQDGSGSQRFLLEFLARQALDARHVDRKAVGSTLSERHAASQLTMNEADVAPGARSSAREYGLGFLSTGWEAFDLALYRGVYFRRLFRDLIDELRSDTTRALAETLGGYEFSDTGRMIWAE